MPAVTAAVSAAATPAALVNPAVEATVALDDGPKPIVTTTRRIWVATPVEIVGIDPGTNTIVDRIARPGTVAMTVDPSPTNSEPLSLYACSALDTVKIDTGRAVVTATYPYGCTGITFGPNALQIVNETRVVEIGPSGDVIATIDVEHGGSGVGAGDESVWVADGAPGAGTITRLGYGTHAVEATITTPATTRDFLATHTGTWVTTTPDRATGDATSLIRIDPATNQIAQTYPEGADAGGLDLSGRFLWVAATGSVFVVDTATNVIVARPDLLDGRAAGYVVASNGSVWLTIDSPGAVVRVDPGSFGDSTSAANPPAGTRIEVAGGCPTTIGTRA
ncbi:MAG: hypothetical protein JWL72_972, partial [Ilumatobacteraceae bacterium]|nr:hypothetical protein [Ilumatobacteraceae bacterium]